MTEALLGAAGFTLTELLITMVLAGTVLGSLYGFYRTQLHGIKSREKSIEILEEARIGMDGMAREIRNAGYWGDSTNTRPVGCERIQAASATSLRIQSDIQGSTSGSSPDSSCDDSNEDLTFAYASANRRITRQSGLGGAVTIVQDVSSALFEYFREGAITSFSPSTQADRDAIRKVSISFTVSVPNPDPNVGGNLTVTLTTNAMVRNKNACGGIGEPAC